MSILLIGDGAPDFVSETQDGPFRFHDWLDGSWAVLFSHPKDFTPVCSTEVTEVARLRDEFAARGVKVATLSTGTAASHREWAAELTATFDVPVDFPLIVDDEKLTIARRFGMVHPKASDLTTIRSVFVIDPDRIVRATFSYPHTTGRNFPEILRVIDSLQLADRAGIVTPVNWRPGDDVLVPVDIETDEARRRFGSVTEHLPYLRTATVAATAD
ncbi:MAG: redoxin domain-containing protein [Gordonia sp. (in: high G+C Gram-positive bacteria)]|uniref:redoxin domain-containing protein n=1 Tax=Gordonia sp. (in: high G+C Gram-positive bacteria) TaxID=84139 RepID=UPI0039E698EA